MKGMATQAEIDAAIDSILDGEHQSYSIGNRSVSKLDLEKLLKVRRELAKLDANSARGSNVSLAKMRRAK